MAKPPIVDEDLKIVLDRAVLQNEHTRASLLAGLFAALSTFLMIRLIAAAVDSSSGAPISRIAITFAVSALLLVLELMYRQFIARQLSRTMSAPSVVWYLMTCLEFAVLVVSFAFSSDPGGSSLAAPVLGGYPGQVAILLIFVMLSVFRLQFFITAFTGLLAGTSYLVLAFVNAGPQGMALTGGSEPYVWVAGIVMGCGVLAGFVALRIRRQTLRLAHSLQERQRLQGEVLLIASEEQRRIGQDLHDGLGSHLTGASMLCRGLARRLDKRESIQQVEIEELAKMIEDGVTQARLLARGLNPVEEDVGGLPIALAELATSTQAVSGTRCTFDDGGVEFELASDSSEHLYRIAQEAVNNAVKHSTATEIKIGFQFAEGEAELYIADNGTGMPATTHLNGFGIRSMGRRAEIIGGHLEIDDGPTGGTVIRCRIPVPE